ARAARRRARRLAPAAARDRGAGPPPRRVRRGPARLAGRRARRERRADPAAHAPPAGAARASRPLSELDRHAARALAALLRPDRRLSPRARRADRPYAPQPRAPLPRGGRRAL